MFYWKDSWTEGEQVEYFDPEKFSFRQRRRGLGITAIILAVLPYDRYVRLHLLEIGLLTPSGNVGKKLIVSDEHIKIQGRTKSIVIYNETSLDERENYHYKNIEGFREAQPSDIITFTLPSVKKGLFESGRRYRCISVDNNSIVISTEGGRIKITYHPRPNEEVL